MRLVFFDLETGGMDPARHPIIQIAAIAVDEQLQELDSFEAKLQFNEGECDPAALAHNSYDSDLWAVKAIPAAMAIQNFAAFLRPFADVKKVSKSGNEYHVAQLIGHNAAGFDLPFLKQAFSQAGEFLPASQRVLCTCQRAAFYFQERPWMELPSDFKLATLCGYFGVALGRAHDAMEDVQATAGVYMAMATLDSNIQTRIT